MKTLLFSISLILFCIIAQAQKNYEYNPYESLGKKVEVLTLSNGKYKEVYGNDTIVRLGSVLFNTITMKVVSFVEKDTVYSESGLRPDIVSRWLSPDPLAAKYPDLSPYNFVANNPVLFIDPDGREIKIHYTDDAGESKVIVYTAGMAANTGNKFADRTISSLNHLYENDFGGVSERISYLENNGTVNIVQMQDNGSTWERYSGTLEWNDEYWAETNTPNPNTGSTERPPAGALSHELSHAYLTIKAKEEYAKGNEEKGDNLWDASRNESILIPNYENTVNLDAGWGLRTDQPTETAHEGIEYYTVDQETCPYCSTGNLPKNYVEKSSGN